MQLVHDMGINWVFPYRVVHFQDEIILLETMPRVHKRDWLRGNSIYVDLLGNGTVWIDNVLRLFEIVEENSHVS